MPDHARLSVRQYPLVHGRFSFQDEAGGFKSSEAHKTASGQGKRWPLLIATCTLTRWRTEPHSGRRAHYCAGSAVVLGLASKQLRGTVLPESGPVARVPAEVVQGCAPAPHSESRPWSGRRRRRVEQQHIDLEVEQVGNGEEHLPLDRPVGPVGAARGDASDIGAQNWQILVPNLEEATPERIQVRPGRAEVPAAGSEDTPPAESSGGVAGYAPTSPEGCGTNRNRSRLLRCHRAASPEHAQSKYELVPRIAVPVRRGRE
jgi:hypothetical protein